MTGSLYAPMSKSQLATLTSQNGNSLYMSGGRNCALVTGFDRFVSYAYAGGTNLVPVR